MFWLEQDERQVLPPNPEVSATTTATGAGAHGIELAVEFKPVEHPIEPLDNDLPIQCPLPEPSILNVYLSFLFSPLSYSLSLHNAYN